MNQPEKLKKKNNVNKNKRNKRSRRQKQNVEYVKKDTANQKELRVVVPGISRNTFTSKWLEVERNYALGLLNPTALLCTRIPSAIPIPTCAASWTGRVTTSLNATGFGFFILNPFNLNTLFVNNHVSLNDTYPLVNNSTTIVPNGIVNSVSISRIRVVSAMLKAVDLSPHLTKTGVIIAGMAAFTQMTHANAVADTLKDAYYSTVIPSQSGGKGVGGVYLPLDSLALNFDTLGSQPNFFAPFVYFSGCAANAQISLDYHINYEYIPVAGQTDLLRAVVGDIGDPTSGIRISADMMKTAKGKGNLGRVPIHFALSKPGSART